MVPHLCERHSQAMISMRRHWAVIRHAAHDVARHVAAGLRRAALSERQPNRIKSENGSKRSVSPRTSDSSRYSSQQPQQPLPQHTAIPPQHMNGLQRCTSPSQMQAPIPNPPDHAYGQPELEMSDQQQHQGGRPASDSGPPEAFACSTCGKGGSVLLDCEVEKGLRDGEVCRPLNDALKAGEVVLPDPSLRLGPDYGTSKRKREAAAAADGMANEAAKKGFTEHQNCRSNPAPCRHSTDQK
ncbi:hypothetical protein FB567DRAFT_612790 [Paraphoma chrysanthemicola]|uniref:Uncharacterized protein n=1 Tax=Paraphoma chrysanthemicola TaxID=798071 RepID=A0A8K0QTT1_9PLEO|nr:hypothetical protein FB567DRAFT_612790 [Paraphoma chrysanthemicola]